MKPFVLDNISQNIVIMFKNIQCCCNVKPRSCRNIAAMVHFTNCNAYTKGVLRFIPKYSCFLFII